MSATESAVYRVLPGEPDRDGLALLKQGTEEPVYVRADGYHDTRQTAVDAIGPGHLVDATLEWPADGKPALTDLTVETNTCFEFIDDADHIFEQAKRTFEQAKREHMAIGSQVTYSTDGEPNGALYTFTKQDSEKDIFAEFRNGRMTLEPMIEKLEAGGGEPPFEVFVIRPTEPPFLVVFLTLKKDGLLANTIRDEY